MSLYEGTKHSTATHPKALGANERLLAQLMGHRDARSVEKYTMLGSAAIRAGLERLHRRGRRGETGPTPQHHWLDTPKSGSDHGHVPVLIRDAGELDALGISVLLQELGYDVDPKDASARITAIASSADSNVVVAVDDRVIAGLISSHVIPLLAEGGCFVRITALCIAEGHWNRGIGRALVEEIEKRAKAVGARLIEVSSGRRPERAAAHSFYPTLGFVDSAHSSSIYRKDLLPDTA